MEKSFKEVIADIKEGEIWVSDFKTIIKSKDMILISNKSDRLTSTFGFYDNIKFKLNRKEYTFEEAFKSYEQGKEIESFTGARYMKLAEESFGREILIEEIRNKWYINS